MERHRGLSVSNIAQEGLEGIPGVLITVFFVYGGLLLLLDLFAPAFARANSTRLVVIYLLVSAGACIAYVLSQRRDRRLAAQVEEQFRELSAPKRQPDAAATRARADERDAAAPDREPHSLGPEPPVSVAAADGSALQGLFAVIVWFFFLWGMISMFVSWRHQTALLSVFAAVSGGIVIGAIAHRVFRRWRARRLLPSADPPSKHIAP